MMYSQFFSENEKTLSHIAESGEFIRPWSFSSSEKADIYTFNTSDRAKYRLNIYSFDKLISNWQIDNSLDYIDSFFYLYRVSNPPRKDVIALKQILKTISNPSHLEIEFSRVEQGIPTYEKPQGESYDKRVVFEVFATIRAALNSFFTNSDINFDIITFGASIPSKQRLYDDLSKVLVQKFNLLKFVFNTKLERKQGQGKVFLLIKSK